MTCNPISRRTFLKVGTATGGGLLLALNFADYSSAENHADSGDVDVSAELNAFVEIRSDGRITIVAPCPEIGQGVRTALPMLVAEELEVNWEAVIVRQAISSEKYGGMIVGGSDSVVDYWEPLRHAGAAAREMLKHAAAGRWGVAANSCVAKGGTIEHPESGRRAAYGELTAEAALLQPPQEVHLKDPSTFFLLGKDVGNVDNRAIVTGAATYGMDVHIPGMHYATIARCPVQGGRLKSFDADNARKVTGVVDVFEIEPIAVGGLRYGAVRAGVVVVARNTWAAIKGKEALNLVWDEGANHAESTTSIRARFRERAAIKGDYVLRDDGDHSPAEALNGRRIEVEYELPALGHGCMEPMNFTADVRADGAVLRGPTQNPRYLAAVAAAALQLPRESVSVHPTMAGGGYGRRLAFDYGVEAALAAKKAGVPLMVVWTREDDIRHDYYRTPSHHRLQARIDENGRIVSWYHHALSASLARNSQLPREEQEPDHPGIYDVQGAADMPYSIPATRVEYTPIDIGLQMGSWRSVSHSFNVFAVNCFVDELAAASSTDPLEMQLRLLGPPRIAEITLPLPGRRGSPRPDIALLRGVLELAADKGSWARSTERGRGRGIACCYYKNTYAAHVAEVSVDAAGKVRVHRIVAAIDCGFVVNPDGARAQAEGAAMDGVATVLHWRITLQNGRVQQSNFNDYPQLTIDRAPTVEVHLVRSDRPPSGMGEPPYPSVAPAIANAIFAASGVRIRRLPVKPTDFLC